MVAGLTIRIVELDVDYLGIEIRAANNRFAGSTRIYARLNDLSDFAAQIDGFPASAQDERTYEFGSRDSTTAGGYGRLHFRCLDKAGHPAIYIFFVDDERYRPPGSVHLSFRIGAAEIDRFIRRLREIEH
jgi:hypothetical protein